MAHKKAGGSSRNGRDSNSKRLGVKSYGGELIPDRLLNPLEIEQSHAQWQVASAEPFLNLAGQTAAASPPALSSTS